MARAAQAGWLHSALVTLWCVVCCGELPTRNGMPGLRPVASWHREKRKERKKVETSKVIVGEVKRAEIVLFPENLAK